MSDTARADCHFHQDIKWLTQRQEKTFSCNINSTPGQDSRGCCWNWSNMTQPSQRFLAKKGGVSPRKLFKQVVEETSQDPILSGSSRLTQKQILRRHWKRRDEHLNYKLHNGGNESSSKWTRGRDSWVMCMMATKASQNTNIAQNTYILGAWPTENLQQIPNLHQKQTRSSPGFCMDKFCPAHACLFWIFWPHLYLQPLQAGELDLSEVQHPQLAWGTGHFWVDRGQFQGGLMSSGNMGSGGQGHCAQSLRRLLSWRTQSQCWVIWCQKNPAATFLTGTATSSFLCGWQNKHLFLIRVQCIL